MSRESRRPLLPLAVLSIFLAFTVGGVVCKTIIGAADGDLSPDAGAPPAAFGVRVLVFDVFGTLVDVFGSLPRQLRDFGTKKGISIDWGKFATDWIYSYPQAVADVRSGQAEWRNLDVIISHSLDALLATYQVTTLTDDDKKEMNAMWEHLDPWPDTVAGLTQLKAKVSISPLSNANTDMMTRLSQNEGLPWDRVLSAEVSHHYKPDPEVYKSASTAFGVADSEVMMVAAHRFDLDVPRTLGMKTAFIRRAGEDNTQNPTAADIEVDTVLDLAKQL